MEFIKKNWIKLILIIASITCGVLMLIPVFMLENFNFAGACQTIALILFFVGIAAVVGLDMKDKTKKIGNFVLLTTGILTLTFFSIGLSGLSKTDAQGAMGKAYAYFATVESTVADGEVTLAEKQAELNAKKVELETSKYSVTALGVLANGWSTIASVFANATLFGTMSNGTYTAGVNPQTTKLEDIVADPTITNQNSNYAKVVQHTGYLTQLVAAGIGEQTLQTAPYVMGGIVAASIQSFPKLEEAIAQLQGVIDSNAAELAVGKASVKDANAAAATVKFLYVCLIIGMGIAPAIIGIKKLVCKDEK